MLPSSHIFSEQNVMLNLRGNRLSINEPNAGLITSTFNGFKEVIIQKDTNGNIISNSNVGNYIYDSNKHNAVTQITPYTNALPGESCAVAYNFFNQPISIEEGDASTPLSNHRLELFYGADQQRNRMMMYRNDTLKTTCYYISKDYETEVDSANITRHYHYIYGDNGAVALYITNETEGTDSMYYIHTDHVGSYVAITDTGKKVVQRNRFAPFGDCGGALYAVLEAPSPTDTLRGNTTLEFPITRRGFTGHEHYPWFKIINMNGRLYDPVICRFFSPDNFVQMPEFTQGYNRYSYCLNNPLKYTDPTGQRFVDVDDLIEVDNTGRITITTQAGNDIVRTSDGRSVELSGNGVFRAALSESSENAIKLIGLSRNDANRIFNLLGDHTGVEWGRLEATNNNGGTDFFIGSSRQAGSEGIISSMIYDLPEGSVQRYDHSHPLLHRSDVNGYRYSRDDANFWNVLIDRHPNSSAGIRFNGQYDLYYRNGTQTDRYNNPLFRY